MGDPFTASAPPAHFPQRHAFSSRRIAVLCAACAGVLATFLPWAHAPIIGSVAGSQGDGWFTLLLFVPALIAAFSGDVRKPLEDPARFIVSLAAAAAGVIGAYKIIQWNANIAEAARELRGNPFADLATMSSRIGMGLYLLTATGFVLPCIAYWAPESAPQAPEPKPLPLNPKATEHAASSLPVWIAAAALFLGLPLVTLAWYKHHYHQQTATFDSIARELELERSATDLDAFEPVSSASWPAGSSDHGTDGLLNSWERSGMVPHTQFSFKGCRLRPGGRWIGEMTNHSHRDYQIANFKLSVYSNENELIETAYLGLFDFKPGQTKSFDCYAPGAPSSFKYKIDYENGF